MQIIKLERGLGKTMAAISQCILNDYILLTTGYGNHDYIKTLSMRLYKKSPILASSSSLNTLKGINKKVWVDDADQVDLKAISKIGDIVGISFTEFTKDIIDLFPNTSD